jgi:hypothetical protein
MQRFEEKSNRGKSARNLLSLGAKVAKAAMLHAT